MNEGELSKFYMFYPSGVPDEKLDQVIDLCERSIKYRKVKAP